MPLSSNVNICVCFGSVSLDWFFFLLFLACLVIFTACQTLWILPRRVLDILVPVNILELCSWAQISSLDILWSFPVLLFKICLATPDHHFRLWLILPHYWGKMFLSILTMPCEFPGFPVWIVQTSPTNLYSHSSFQVIFFFTWSWVVFSCACAGLCSLSSLVLCPKGCSHFSLPWLFQFTVFQAPWFLFPQPWCQNSHKRAKLGNCRGRFVSLLSGISVLRCLIPMS